MEGAKENVPPRMVTRSKRSGSNVEIVEEKRKVKSKQNGTLKHENVVMKTAAKNPIEVAIVTKKQPKMMASANMETQEVSQEVPENREDPQLIAEYQQEVMAHLRQLDADPKVRVRRDYLAGQQEVLPAMRALLVDWMVGTGLQLTLRQETLQLAVSCLDRFLQAELGSVTKNKLQLVGATSLVLAAKFEESFPPEVAELARLAGGGAPATEILSMELRMLPVLDFWLSVPLPLQFLRWARLADPVVVTKQTLCLAKYVSELSLVDYYLAWLPASTRAAASTALAIKIISQTSLTDQWARSLESSTGHSLAELLPPVRKMAKLLETAANSSSLRTVVRKYSSGVFLRVARLEGLGLEAGRLARGGEL